MIRKVLIFLLLSSLSFSAFAFQKKRNHRLLTRRYSIIYALVEKYVFNLDKHLENVSDLPVYFKNCNLVSNDKIIAYSKDGLGTCLYFGFLHKQFSSQARDAAFIETTLHLKRKDESVDAIIHWDPPQVLKSLKTIKDDVFIHDIVIELEKPVRYYDIYPLGALSVGKNQFLDDMVGRAWVQKLVLSVRKHADNPDEKTAILYAYPTNQSTEPIIGIELNMDYTLFDKDFYVYVKGETL